MGLFSYDITVAPEPEFLRITAAGPFSMWKHMRGWARVVREVKRHGARKVLIDGRGVYGDLSFEDLFEIGAHMGAHIRFKVAVLRRRLEKDEFGAWIARYRGANVQLFAEEGEARAWLIKD